MNFKFSELHTKEVIHLADGERLGVVSDMEIDFDTGKVISISVPGGYKMFGMFGREPERTIPWENIKKIGDDLIIIDNNFNIAK